MLATAAEMLLAPLLVGAAGIAAHRWGERVAGLVSAFPAIVGPLLLIGAREHGSSFAARSASGTLLGLVALSAFALVYARAAQRWSWRRSLVVAWLAAAVTAGVASLSEPGPLVAGTVACLGIVTALRALPAGCSDAPRPVITLREVPSRMLVTALLIVSLTTAAGRLGALVSGVLAALPVLASVLAVATHRGQGPAAATELLRGMLGGMTGFVAFCLLVALLLEPAGTAAAFGIATASCLLLQGVAHGAQRGGVLPAAASA